MEIRPNRVKQKLAAGELATIMAGSFNADMIEQVAQIGIDGIWLEGEHGPVDFGDIGDLTRACDLWGLTSVLRIHQNEYGVIYRALDRGAQGIVIPHVNSKAEAEAVVEAGKFQPIGKRGMYTGRQGIGVPNYVKIANDHTLLIVLIEDIVAVHALDEILTVDHIDVFFVAPSDLAASMGHIGEPGHPEVARVRDEAIKKILAAGRTAGTLVTDENVEHFVSMGVRCVMTNVLPWLIAGGQSFLKRAEAGLGR